MKTKSELNKILLFIGIALIALNYLGVFLLPEIDMNRSSPLEIYQRGLVEITLGWMGLIGWTICLIWVVIYFVRKRRRQNECKTCGAKIQNEDDLFCRICGAKLKKDKELTV
jgi:lysylphosphatidylglycerol synthetase-like protein (DUF2156 family)